MFEENRQNEIEELADNIILFVNESYETLQHLEKWSVSVIDPIKLLTKTNIKECSSFSSRAKFKFMDCKC